MERRYSCNISNTSQCMYCSQCCLRDGTCPKCPRVLCLISLKLSNMDYIIGGACITDDGDTV